MLFKSFRYLLCSFLLSLAIILPSHVRGQVKLRPVIPPGMQGQTTTPPSSFPVIHQVAGTRVSTRSALSGGDIETFKVEGVTFRMIKVKGGSYIMGATEEQGAEACDDERPAHEVEVADFYIAETEVTQELWEAVMGYNPSHFKGAKLPVESIRYTDIDLFLMKLEFFTGKRFRLPEEAEWEYAARGGNRSQHTKYAGSNDFEAVAWYCNNSGNRSHDVATKAPNELGLYDMSGNVEEWCSDVWKPYAQGADGETNEKVKVRRGGGFLDFATHLRVSDRRGASYNIFNNDIGIRLAM